VNTGASWPSLLQAKARVLGIQTKLHRWATDDPSRRFDDLFNLVADPAFLTVAWDRVRNNKGARTAGVDGLSVRSIESGRGVAAFLGELRADLKARRFAPLPVREASIPKPGTTKRRRLGIPTVRDRVVQAALKLVLEPIFEADFQPCSYGFRPKRRAHDAVAEIRLLAANAYEWVVDADIQACFDTIDHAVLMDRVRRRVGDKRVLALVKAFLKAGILSEDQVTRDTHTGTPQGGILSPLLANIALSVLDDYFIAAWERDRVARARRRRHGIANYRLIRYADDLVLMISGAHTDAQRLHGELAEVLAPIGLRLSAAKTRICHIDEGFVFLGWRIQRQRKKGTSKRYVYTYPSKAALARIKDKVRERSKRRATDLGFKTVLYRLSSILRGWTNYFRHGVSSVTFQYLRAFTWRRVIGWLRAKHPRATWKQLRRRYLDPGWWPQDGAVRLFNPGAVTTIWYRYRGTAIPSPWSSQLKPEGSTA
jgi:RNA-directed DNA polymerase